MNRADHDHGCARFNEPFVILAQPTGASQPSERPFDHPTVGQHPKSFSLLGTADYAQAIVGMLFQPLVQFVIVIFVIRKDHLHARNPIRLDLTQTSLPALASSTEAAVTTTASSKPMVSTTIWRLRPVIFLPPS